MTNNDFISDSTLTLPHIQRCLEDLIRDLGVNDADPHMASARDPCICLWFTGPGPRPPACGRQLRQTPAPFGRLVPPRVPI